MTPIAPLITAFLREHMPIERGYSPHTCETYAHAFRLLFIFASERLSQRPSQLCLEQIDADLVLNFLAHIEQQRHNDATTRNSRLAAIKAFMRTSNSASLRPEQIRQIHAIRQSAMTRRWCDTSRSARCGQSSTPRIRRRASVFETALCCTSACLRAARLRTGGASARASLSPPDTEHPCL